MATFSVAHDSTTQRVLQTIDVYERPAKEWVARWSMRRNCRQPLLGEWLTGFPADARLLDLGREGDKDVRAIFALDVHRLGHIVQCCFGYLACPSTSLHHNVVQVRRIFTQSRARVPHRRHAFDDAIGDKLLAIDTADGGGPAFGINPLLNCRQ